MKFLKENEINSIIKGIEDGDIIIGDINKTEMSPDEIEKFKIERKRRYDLMSDEDKEHIKKLSKKYRKEDKDFENRQKNI